MSKTKVILLGLLAAFALSAISSSATSAHEFKVEESEIAKSSPQTILGLSPSKFMQIHIGGKPYVVRCVYDIVRGTMGNGGTTVLEINEYNCFFVGALPNGRPQILPGCKLPAVIRQFATDTLPQRGIDKWTGEKTEETLLEFTVEGTKPECEIEGKYKVKGSMTCAIPEVEYEKVLHELICTPAESNLHDTREGKEETESVVQIFDVEDWSLEGNKKWSAN
jgi:hypothetical protein